MIVPSFLILVAAIALLVGLYTLWGSLRSALGAEEISVANDVEAESRKALLERKKALLSNLQDLRFEREAGKVSEEDFAELDAKLRGQARDVLRRLDADIEAFREKATELVRDRISATGNTPYRDAAKSSGPREDARLCTKCNTANDDDARFCKACAAPLRDSNVVTGEGAQQEASGETDSDPAEAAPDASKLQGSSEAEPLPPSANPSAIEPSESAGEGT